MHHKEGVVWRKGTVLGIQPPSTYGWIGMGGGEGGSGANNLSFPIRHTHSTVSVQELCTLIQSKTWQREGRKVEEHGLFSPPDTSTVNSW